jgi:hypothetical protein
MLARLKRAMNYWMFAVSHPGYVLDVAQRDLHRVRISFFIILVFSLMYSFTSLLLWASGRVPTIEPWIDFIPVGEYYLYQVAWTPVWMVSVWLVSAGIIYLFISLVRKEAYYEDALMISALSISIPYLMFWWIPETFLLPAMGMGSWLRWPDLFEMERKFMFPALWQLALVTFGMRKLYNANRIACLLAGMVAVGLFFGFFIPYMR